MVLDYSSREIGILFNRPTGGQLDVIAPQVPHIEALSSCKPSASWIPSIWF